MKTRIENVKILTMDGENRVYEDGCVLVDGDRIEKVGDRKEAAGWSGGAEAAVLDGRGGILIPGLINTHCHVSMMPFRTLGDDCADRLRRFLFPLENDAMTRRLVYRAARYGICEMLLAGVTTFLDMYYFEDEVAKACEELGMRGFLGETVIGQAVHRPGIRGGIYPPVAGQPSGKAPHRPPRHLQRQPGDAEEVL